MLELLDQKLVLFAILHKNKSVWRKIVTALASIAVFCVTYALILPAITVEQESFCGLEEHTHTEECYRYEPVLICGLEGEDAPIVSPSEGSEIVSEEPDGDDVEEVTIDGQEEREAVGDPDVTEAVEENESSENVPEAQEESPSPELETESAEVAESAPAEKTEHTEESAPAAQETAPESAPAVEEKHSIIENIPLLNLLTPAFALEDDEPAESETAPEEAAILEKHIHTVECYEYRRVPACGHEEHVHSLQCYSDPHADVENRGKWQHMADAVERSGDPRKDVLAFAESQLGYTESTKNYQVMEDGTTMHGYTRYGAWYGDPYGDWCAMFCSFCLRYSGVEDYPTEASCTRWIKKLSNTYGENGVYYHSAESYTPQPGDLIFFDWDPVPESESTARTAEHVGFVYRIEPATADAPAQITTIEGNRGDQVCFKTYSADDTQILGYGELMAEEATTFEREFKGEDFTVYVSYDRDAGIPADAELTVREILPDTDEFGAYYDQTLQTLKEQDDTVEGIDFVRFFDVGFVCGGEKLEPNTPVNVSIIYDNPVVVEENMGEMTVHFADSGVELLETSTSQTVEYAPENTVNTFEFTTESFSVIGAGTVVYQEKTGTYYKRVTSLTPGKTYLIVSAEGNMALRNNNTNYTPVKLQPVKDNEGYYEISGVTDQMRWTLNAISTANTNNNVFRLRSVSNNNTWVRIGGNAGDALLNTNTNYRNTKFTRNAANNTWTLNSNDTAGYYLYNSGAAFTKSNDTDNTINRNFIILEQVNETLRIPDDVIPAEEGGGDDPMVKPHYDPDTENGEVTGAIRQDFTKVGVPEDVQNDDETVKWFYASDPSTSNIEKYYQKSRYSDLMAQDGMVMTDKSVIFGGDDYKAFGSYEPGEFSATLSALGQDYHLQVVDQLKIPVDVMFVLDVSGSMKTVYEGETRLEALVKATNNAIKQIMEANNENRVGIALYSSGGQLLLPLDRYDYNHARPYSETDAYIRIVDDTSYTTTATPYVQPSNYVCTQKGISNATFRQSYGTYTQYGIQLGAEEMLANPDTTYTQTMHAGTEYEKDITVVRQPVMILLSDGDPTHCSSNYTDPISGPHYGDGIANSANNQGIQGFYTILTANYFKRMVGIHYEAPAAFFTIGLGINEDGIEDSSGASRTGDHYKRAVLDPSAANIAALNNASASNADTTGYQLRDLLNNAAGRPEFITVQNATKNFEQLGNIPQTRVPVLNNPYANNYGYADGSFFGYLNAAQLTDIFDQIISSHIKVKTYGFMLNARVGSGAKVTIYDPIGKGMEVNMDTPADYPVFRYNGKNYAYTSVSRETVGGSEVTTLAYQYTATTHDGSGGPEGERTAELKEITVTITTDSTGMQTVKMQIPERDLPAYTPGPDGSDYYYEELPARLIYKVRLTEESKEAIRNLREDDGELTFYTNEWNGDTSAYATQDPHKDNPYYCDVTYYNEDGTVDTHNPPRQHQYAPFGYDKSANPTGTAGKSFDSTADLFDSSGAVHEDGEVYMALGNNGKLVFKASTGSDLEVTKQWQDTEGNPVAEPEVPSVTVQLLRNGEPYGEPATITAADDWKHLFTDLPNVDGAGNAYEYTIAEVDVFGYYSSVSELTYNSERMLYEITVTNRKLITRDLPVEKRWEDSGHNGDSVTVHLYANGEDTGLSKVLNSGNNWRDVFAGIPARDQNNAEIVYTIREEAFPGYTANYEWDDIDFGSTEWAQVAANGTFSSSQVYQIRYGESALAIVDGTLQLLTPSDTDTRQQWRLNGSGSSSIRNVATNQYINISTNSNAYTLTNTAQTLTINAAGKIYITTGTWTRTTRYLRYSSSQGGMVVGTNNSANTFTFWQLDSVEDMRNGLVVTNSPRSGIEISADKVWENVPDDAKQTVTLKVYDVEIATNKAVGDPVATLTLSAGSGWHDYVYGLPKPASGHTYAVVEDAMDGFEVKYSEEGEIYIDSELVRAYYTHVELGEDDLIEVIVTNEISFTLPQTGGVGTTVYTVGGLLMLAAAAAVYINFVRRRREGSGF